MLPDVTRGGAFGRTERPDSPRVPKAAGMKTSAVCDRHAARATPQPRAAGTQPPAPGLEERRPVCAAPRAASCTANRVSFCHVTVLQLLQGGVTSAGPCASDDVAHGKGTVSSDFGRGRHVRKLR